MQNDCKTCEQYKKEYTLHFVKLKKWLKIHRNLQPLCIISGNTKFQRDSLTKL